MSNFKDDDYVKEFICRTQMNYFKIQNLVGYNKEAEISYLKEIMLANEFEYQNYYEVTQLINSFLGLLVFPKEKYFNFLSNRENDFQNVPTLKRVTDKTYKGFISTYREIRCERTIIKHLRNAVCHDRLMIHPLNHNVSTEIQAIQFEDEDIRDGHGAKFSLIIDINDLEKILLELDQWFLKY